MECSGILRPDRLGQCGGRCFVLLPLQGFAHTWQWGFLKPRANTWNNEKLRSSKPPWEAWEAILAEFHFRIQGGVEALRSIRPGCGCGPTLAAPFLAVKQGRSSHPYAEDLRASSSSLLWVGAYRRPPIALKIDKVKLRTRQPSPPPGAKSHCAWSQGEQRASSKSPDHRLVFASFVRAWVGKIRLRGVDLVNTGDSDPAAFCRENFIFPTQPRNLMGSGHLLWEFHSPSLVSDASSLAFCPASRGPAIEACRG